MRIETLGPCWLEAADPKKVPGLVLAQHQAILDTANPQIATHTKLWVELKSIGIAFLETGWLMLRDMRRAWRTRGRSIWQRTDNTVQSLQRERPRTPQSTIRRHHRSRFNTASHMQPPATPVHAQERLHCLATDPDASTLQRIGAGLGALLVVAPIELLYVSYHELQANLRRVWRLRNLNALVS